MLQNLQIHQYQLKAQAIALDEHVETLDAGMEICRMFRTDLSLRRSAVSTLKKS